MLNEKLVGLVICPSCVANQIARKQSPWRFADVQAFFRGRFLAGAKSSRRKPVFELHFERMTAEFTSAKPHFT